MVDIAMKNIFEIFRKLISLVFSKICWIKKNAAKRDNAGAVCNSGMGMLFFMYSICLHYFFKGVGGGGWKHFFDTRCIMHDAGYTLLNAVPPPPSLWSYRLCLKSRLFCTCAHAWCHIHFFHHVKFYFRFRQLIAFPVSGQLCCDSQGKESSTFFSGNMKYPYIVTYLHFGGRLDFFRLSAFFRLSSFFW